MSNTLSSNTFYTVTRPYITNKIKLIKQLRLLVLKNGNLPLKEAIVIADFIQKYDRERDLEINNLRRDIRLNLAKYMRSEGCSCCQAEDHRENRNSLGRLLKVPMYPDGSGYDFVSLLEEDYE